MKYSEILKIIYGNDLQQIIKILNFSIYVTDFKMQKNSIVVNTGFSFKTHNLKTIELYYELESESIIRQPKLELLSVLQINGLVCVKDKRDYFNQYLEFILTEISENENNGTFYFLKDPEKYLELNSINEIFVIKDNKRVYKLTSILVKKGKSLKSKYPYFKDLAVPLFYDGTQFSLYEDYDLKEPNNDYDDTTDDNDIWDGENPYPGIDACDWRGG
jgi:hypothetical protein